MFTLKAEHDEEIISLKQELQITRSQLYEAQATR